ncbi:MAG: glycosyltransferase family 39 protein [Phycisphaeraceae bacterium]|nr:glycosyltransferase family 39 protein [Phycisphaeraceae bacterium]
MTYPLTHPDDRRSGWGPVLWLIGIVSVLRVIYLLTLCPYDLVEDEAFYWEWSRHLDWSYSTKGPGIALLIRAATDLFGPSEAGIRAVAVASMAVAAMGAAGLAKDVCSRRHAALWAAGMVLLAPALQLMGLITTIDGPTVACWSVGCWAGWRALMTGSGRAWAVLAAAVAVGTLVKYTVLLLPLGLVIFALTHRRSLRLSARWQLGAALVVLAALGALAPVVYWNVREGWPTVRHLVGHLNLPGGDHPGATRTGWGYTPIWTLELVGAQLGLLGPAVLLGVGGLVVRGGRRATLDEGMRSGAPAYLGWCAGGIFAFYVVVSFINRTQGNWPLPGGVTLLVMAGCVVATVGQTGAGRWAWSWAGALRSLTVAVGVLVAAATLRADWTAATLAAVHPSLARPIPMGRLVGASSIAAQVELERHRLRERTGMDAFVIAANYGRASQIAYYLPGRPRGTVLCATSWLGGRLVQQDFWTELAPTRPDLAERPAVLVGADAAAWAPMFERVEPLPPLTGDHKGAFAGIGYGYRADWRQR